MQERLRTREDQTGRRRPLRRGLPAGRPRPASDGHYAEFIGAIRAEGPVFAETHLRCFSDVDATIPINDAANTLMRPFVRKGFEFRNERKQGTMNKRLLFGCVAMLGVSVVLAGSVPSEFQTGMTWGFAARSGFFASDEARKDVDDMAAVGIRWVVLTPNVWQEQYCSTRQFADFEKSIPDFELMDIIDYIHRKGMRVQLRPMLECHDGTGRHGVIVGDDWERVAGKPRGYCRKWFDSMRARSVWYARLAERTKCEMYCLDSEFDKFIGKSAQWKSVIAAVRKVYSGPITSSHTIHCGDFDWEKVVADKDHWFYDLDILSVSDYTAARPRGNTDKLSVEEMMKNLEPHRDLLRRVAKTYGKPLMFGECGCGPRRYQAAGPSGCDMRQPEDAHEQEVYYEAFIRAFKDEPWCHGFYWWRWNSHTLADSSDKAGTTALSAPGVSFAPAAETKEVLRRYYGELNQGKAK